MWSMDADKSDAKSGRTGDAVLSIIFSLLSYLVTKFNMSQYNPDCSLYMAVIAGK